MDEPAAAPVLPPAPDLRLGHTAPVAWIALGLAYAVASGITLSVLLPVLDDIDGVPGWVNPVLIATGVLADLLAVLVRPAVLSRTWRYAVREDEIDLRRGWVVRTRTIIPMTRVQHVDTMQSGLGALLDVQTLRIHTAAGEHAIPYLDQAVADELRVRIAERAHVPDEL